MGFMIELSASLQELGIFFIFHIEIYHGRPQSAFWGHKDFIWLINGRLLKQHLPMSGFGEVPAILESKANDSSSLLLSKVGNVASTCVDLPNDLGLLRSAISSHSGNAMDMLGRLFDLLNCQVEDVLLQGVLEDLQVFILNLESIIITVLLQPKWSQEVAACRWRPIDPVQCIDCRPSCH